MVNDKKRVFGNSVITTFSSIFEQFVFFIVNIIISRYLTVNDFGLYSTALGFATFFSMFTDIGMNTTLIRALNVERGKEREHFTSVVVIKTLLSIIVFTVMSISLLFTNYTTEIIFLTLLFGVVRIGNNYQSTFYSLYNAKEKFKMSSFYRLSFAVCFLAGTYIVIFFKGDYFDIAYLRTGVVILFLLWMGTVTFKKIKLKFSWPNIKSFARDSIPFGKSTIYANIILRTGIVILPLLHDPSLSGIFNNGQIFLFTLFFIPNSLANVITPYLFKHKFDDNKEKFQFAYDVFTKALSIIGFFLFLTLFLFARDIILLIYGTKYTAAIPILQIISFGVMFSFTISGTIITTLDLQKIRTKIDGNTVIFAIIFNFVLIKLYKVEGAAFATIATQVVSFVLYHYFLIKNRYIKINKMAVLFLKLIVISIIAYYIKNIFLINFHYIYSAIIFTIYYIIACLILIINKDDIRISKEIFLDK